MTDLPSDWHIQEAINRMDWGGTPPTVNTVKSSHYIHVLAHARTLEEFLPKPVDPYAEAAAQLMEIYNWEHSAKSVREGTPDLRGKAFLAKLRELFPAYGDTRTNLEIAREATEQMYDTGGFRILARSVLSGNDDSRITVQTALLAVRMARGEA